MTKASYQSAEFSSASALIVSESDLTRKFLAETLKGFGFGSLDPVNNFADGRQHLQQSTFSLCLVDVPPDGDEAFAFVEWLRSSGPETAYFIPVMLLAANITSRILYRSRDCGAHFVMSKPAVPDQLMKRVQWLAAHDREFVNTETYKGPDRRFRFEGPPPGMSGRRASDLSATIGDAHDPNLEQDDIDALLKPQKISL